MHVKYDDEEDISALTGNTLVAIKNNNDDELVFIDSDGQQWLMYHAQDCCESVSIDDIAGDLDDLIGSPILSAEKVSSDEEAFQGPRDEYDDSYTWTFYKLATNKGSVTIRWYGTSNGYYSESVTFGKASVTRW